MQREKGVYPHGAVSVKRKGKNLSKRCDLVKQEQGLPAESGVFPGLKHGCGRHVWAFWRCCFCAGLRPGAADAAKLGRQLEVARDGQNLVLGPAAAHIPEGFHAYSHEPGDAGRPTVLTLEPVGGPRRAGLVSDGAVQRDYYDPSVTVSVYEGETLLFARVPAAAAGNRIRAR